MERVLILLLSCALAHALAPQPKCGVAVQNIEKLYTPGGRVVGGKVAQDQSWPWIGALMQQKPGYYPYQFCGGTLLSDEWFITAGHCVDSLSEEEIMVRVNIMLGEKDLYKGLMKNGGRIPASLYTISKVIKHEQYDVPRGSTNNDVALLKLSRKVVFNNDVRPACLPSQPIITIAPATLTNRTNGRRICFVAGWGHTAEGQKHQAGGPMIGAGSDTVQQVDIEMYKTEDCKRKLAGYYFGSNMICGGFDKGGKDSCQGDSGGPLVCKAASGAYELQGVVSWGAGCARAEMPGIYANVFNLKSWIEKKMSTN